MVLEGLATSSDTLYTQGQYLRPWHAYESDATKVLSVEIEDSAVSIFKYSSMDMDQPSWQMRRMLTMHKANAAL